MAIGRVIARLSAAVLLAASFVPALYAAPPEATPPHPDSDPFGIAQQQIARLRQTAGQLRLLADQPIPKSLPIPARAELARHEQWLHQAEQQISALASQWEDQLKSLDDRNARVPAHDLNAFFVAQSETLQAKLRRESLAQHAESPHVQSSGATARLVIGNMY